MEKYSLVGVDGNAFSVIAYVERAMRREKFTREEIKEYETEAKSKDYDHLLQVSMDYIDKANDRAEGGEF